MMRMLWVMMGMFVPFVAPSLTLKRFPCVTSVNCNIVRIALTPTHVTMRHFFESAPVSCCAHKLRILNVNVNKQKDICVFLRVATNALFMAFPVVHDVCYVKGR